MNNFQQRMAIGGMSAAFFILAITLAARPYFRLPFAILTSLVACGALLEYYKLARRKELPPLTSCGIAVAFAFLLSVFFSTQSALFSGAPLLVAWVGVCLMFFSLFRRGADPLASLAVTWFGASYIALPFAALLLLTYHPSLPQLKGGPAWLFYLVFTTKGADIGAYVCGKLLGKRPLCSFISPKKTWEGACGSVIAAMVISVLFAWCSAGACRPGILLLTWPAAICLGACIGVTAQFGDLAESLLKRDAAVKDSGQLPGLGGFLDIVDSLLFTAPLVYLYAMYMA